MRIKKETIKISWKEEVTKLNIGKRFPIQMRVISHKWEKHTIIKDDYNKNKSIKIKSTSTKKEAIKIAKDYLIKIYKKQNENTHNKTNK